MIRTIVSLPMVVLTTLAWMSPLDARAEAIAGKRPNILFILTDDQGFCDISAHGNPTLKTLNLVRNVKEA